MVNQWHEKWIWKRHSRATEHENDEVAIGEVLPSRSLSAGSRLKGLARNGTQPYGAC